MSEAQFRSWVESLTSGWNTLYNTEKIKKVKNTMKTPQSMSDNPDIIGTFKPRNHRRKPPCARKVKIFVRQSEIQKGREK
jgi:hypothetical protein